MIERPSVETLRWMASFTLVVSVHGAAALLALEWQSASEPDGAPPAAIVIDLVPAAPEPEPVVPEVEPPPPEPQLVQKPPEPELARELPPPETLPVPPEPEPLPPEPVVDPEVALPAVHPPMPPPSAQPPVEKSPPSESAPPAISEAATAPQADNSALLAGAIETWQAVLLAHLERHKRYPREAQWLKQEGIVEVRFVMDRAGKVLESSIESSSDSAALDEEAIALLARAQPLPEPPEEMRDETFELVVPVQFALKR
ncbi:MAG: TonB family protein [Pseudomonadota bacterium]|nr:TonB family protein [Pseudomonadota bacterium]